MNCCCVHNNKFSRVKYGLVRPNKHDLVLKYTIPYNHPNKQLVSSRTPYQTSNMIQFYLELSHPTSVHPEWSIPFISIHGTKHYLKQFYYFCYLCYYHTLTLSLVAVFGSGKTRCLKWWTLATILELIPRHALYRHIYLVLLKSCFSLVQFTNLVCSHQQSTPGSMHSGKGIIYFSYLSFLLLLYLKKLW